MKIWRAIEIGFVLALICLGLLFLAYPWSTYYSNFRYSAGVTFGSYLLLSVSVGIVGMIVAGSLSFTKISALPSGILSGVLCFIFLLLGSLLLGPEGIDPFDIRIRGIFFAEWNFLTFIGLVALPISFLNAVLTWRVVRKAGVRRASSP